MTNNPWLLFVPKKDFKAAESDGKKWIIVTLWEGQEIEWYHNILVLHLTVGWHLAFINHS